MRSRFSFNKDWFANANYLVRSRMGMQVSMISQKLGALVDRSKQIGMTTNGRG